MFTRFLKSEYSLIPKIPKMHEIDQQRLKYTLETLINSFAQAIDFKHNRYPHNKKWCYGTIPVKRFI